MQNIHMEKSYDDWIKNFALNLNNIWNENSARSLDPTYNLKLKLNKNAIVIGAGPSLAKHNHLELLSKSNFQGAIICTDRILANALKAGVTPNKFPNYFVVTIDPAEKIKNFYEDKIIKKYGSKINGIFSSVSSPLTLNAARKSGIRINWIHSLFDYDEGKKSFNQISGMMVKSKNHISGLPGIQTGGNVGTACWFISWTILRCKSICLIGIDHSWSVDDDWDHILKHSKIPKEIMKRKSLFAKLFPKIFNPDFQCNCILDPIFQYYSQALKEFIKRSPYYIKTINATEGGCIFGDRIFSIDFKSFLKDFSSNY